MNMADSKARHAAQVLLGLVDQQRRLYRALRSLADRQAELVTAGSADGLLKVLADRQRLVDEITKTSSALQPFRQRWDAVCKLLDEQQRSEVAADIAEIDQLQEAIAQRDQRDSETLRLRCQVIGRELQRSRTSKDAIRAYHEDAQGRQALNEATG